MLARQSNPESDRLPTKGVELATSLRRAAPAQALGPSTPTSGPEHGMGVHSRTRARRIASGYGVGRFSVMKRK